MRRRGWSGKTCTEGEEEGVEGEEKAGERNVAGCEALANRARFVTIRKSDVVDSA
jgi:hypothetical protein